MSFTVIQPGLFSLLVDSGRPDRRELGIPVGGAADRAAYRLGQALVGNPPGLAALEITLAGPMLEADGPVHGVLMGAEFDCCINDQPWPTGLTFQLARGDRLAMAGCTRGARAYLCVRGGFDVPPRLGSRSAFAPLAGGQTLPCPMSRGRSRRRLAEPWPLASVPLMLDLLPGSQIAAATRELLAGQRYVVEKEANRQGVRLRAPRALPAWPTELVSAPVCPGTVQLPAGGQPIILGVDAQTIGGYPRLGHVISAHLDALAQLRPGKEVRFRFVTQEEAQAKWREREARLVELETWVRASV